MFEWQDAKGRKQSSVVGMESLKIGKKGKIQQRIAEGRPYAVGVTSSLWAWRHVGDNDAFPAFEIM